MLQLSPMLSNTLLSRHQWLELAKVPFGYLGRQPGWASKNSGISLTMVGETGWTSDHLSLSPPLLALHLSRLQDTQSIHVQAESWMSPQPSHAQPVLLCTQAQQSRVLAIRRGQQTPTGQYVPSADLKSSC